MAVFFAAAVCCVLLYFWCMMPARRSMGKNVFFGKRYYAHRGLHGKDVCENSMEAFRNAVEAGYGIELDVRLTKDGLPVVFHDDDLKRLCGRETRVSDMAWQEMQGITLPDGQSIPLLSQVLETVAGRVPLLVEIKSSRMGDTAVSQKVLEQLKGYGGPYAVQSFDPFQLRYLRKHAAQLIRGQLARQYPGGRGFSVGRVAERLAGNLVFNGIGRPDYVAYQHTDTGKMCCRMIRRIFKAPLAVWTVCSEAEEEKVESISDVIIFEGYLPKQNGEENR